MNSLDKLNELKEKFSRNKYIIICGNRQIGKTTLIQTFLDSQNANVYLLGYPVTYTNYKNEYIRIGLGENYKNSLRGTSKNDIVIVDHTFFNDIFSIIDYASDYNLNPKFIFITGDLNIKIDDLLKLNELNKITNNQIDFIPMKL